LHTMLSKILRNNKILRQNRAPGQAAPRQPSHASTTGIASPTASPTATPRPG